jgi:hypothetical protein
MDRLRKTMNKLGIVILGIMVLLEAFVILNLIRINDRLLVFSKGQFSETQALSEDTMLIQLRREAFTRSVLYERLIERDMLSDGMVIHRGPAGEVLGLCDSLLFSNLRYFALKKMGLHDEARAAWKAILESRQSGQWLRHPKCLKSISRDMIMGVLVGLSANPEGGDIVFEEMLAEIDRQQGFVGDGPFYVSWLSPGIAGLLRAEAERRNVPFEKWPWIVKQSFSSIEYDAMFLAHGYVSHLAALGLNLELSAIENNRKFNPRSFLGEVESWIKNQSPNNMKTDRQRRQWIATHLRTLSHSNLYFDWLEQKTFGQLNPANEKQLLERLLSMSQFPIDSLPQDCDRDADYLWQRRDEDAFVQTSECKYRWNGVDFIWMAAMLGAGKDGKNHENEPQNPAIELSH